MSGDDGRNKKKSLSTTISSIPNSSTSNPNLPIGDPFERILTTPKESLIQRSASPRRATASPLKMRENLNETCLEQLPKLSGKT